MASRHGLSSELERSLENLRRAFVETNTPHFF